MAMDEGGDPAAMKERWTSDQGRWFILDCVPRVVDHHDNDWLLFCGYTFRLIIDATPRATKLSLHHWFAPEPPSYPYVAAVGPNGRFFLCAARGPEPEREPVPRSDDGFTMEPLVLAHLPDSAYYLGTIGIGTVDFVRVCDPPRSTLNPAKVGLIGEKVVELQTTVGSDHADLLIYSLASKEWVVETLDCPRLHRPWGADGVITNDDKVWWVDLSSGLLVCDLSARPREVALVLSLVPAPLRTHSAPNLHQRRCVGVCCGALSYVLIHECHINNEPVVSMWTLNETTGTWGHDCERSFASIWDEESFKATNLRREVPAVALIHPNHRGGVYFFLDSSIVGIDLFRGKMLESELFDMPHPPPPFRSARFIRALHLPGDGLSSLITLPKDLITKILSYLPTKDAARAAATCTHFALGWSSQLFLSFRLGEKPRPSMFKCITTALHKHDGSIKGFSLEGSLHCAEDEILNNWLPLICEKSPGITTLKLNSTSEFILPAVVFTLRYLTELELSLCRIMSGSAIDFPYMKKLLLKNCEFTGNAENELQAFLSKCPACEEMEILYPFLPEEPVYFHTHLDVPSLSTLTVQLDGDTYTRSWSMYAPELRIMKIQVDSSMSMQFLQNCLHVTYLDIKAWSLPASVPFIFQNLKTLKLVVFFDVNCIPSILQILECAPTLEILILESKDAGVWNEPPLFWSEQTDRTLSAHLKKIALNGCCGTDREINLLKFLLSVCSNLEELTIIIDQDMNVDLALGGFWSLQDLYPSVHITLIQ